MNGDPLVLVAETWQRELAKGFRDPAELLAYLGLADRERDQTHQADAAFPLRVPRYFADLMRHGDPADPLLRQVLPVAEELVNVPGYVADPVGDLGVSIGGGLLQKYAGRALLIATGACAVHCRYCFRRHYPYGTDAAIRNRWKAPLAVLSGRPDIVEVILSGGDPLSLSDENLRALLEGLEGLPHLLRLRIHSRLPVVLPARMTRDLIEMLSRSRLAVSLVVHVNHPREVTPRLGEALAPFRREGIVVLNQSVLLAGVNDELQVLAKLSERLFDVGVLPYYLHQLDPVAGAAHFQVDDGRARSLHEDLRAQLPGYLVPRLVADRPEAASKVPL